MIYLCKQCETVCTAGSFDEIVRNKKLCCKCSDTDIGSLRNSNVENGLRKVNRTKAKRKSTVSGTYKCRECDTVHNYSPFMCDNCTCMAFTFIKTKVV